MSGPLEAIQNYLERVEGAIIDGTWADVDLAWTPIEGDIDPADHDVVRMLLQRIEAATEEIARLQDEAADLHDSTDLLRKAGKAYLRNDVPVA